MKRGQQVAVLYRTVGSWRTCLLVTFQRTLKNGLVRVRDSSGSTLDVHPKQVFASKEELEALLPQTRIDVNVETGRVTERHG